jgi:hypothetical protein
MKKMNKRPFSCTFDDEHATATANLFISITFTLTCTHNSCMLQQQQKFFSTSSSFLLDDNSTKFGVDDNSKNSDVNYLYFENFSHSDCIQIENFFEDFKEIREKSSEFPYSEYF